MISINSIKICALGLLYLILQGCVSSQPVQETEARQQITSEEQTYSEETDSSYQIQAGDEIEILVWEQSNFNTETAVSSLGTIAVPLIGELKVDGMTKEELESRLRQELSQYIKGEISLTVSVRSVDGLMVSVFGMVSSPDNYTVNNESSIFKVLSMAGGPLEEADIRNVRIYRNKNNPRGVDGSSGDVTIDLTHYLDNGQVGTSAAVYPGDIVYVPEEQNVIRETSDFLRDVVMLFGIFRVLN